MLTLVSTLLGLLGSFFPELLKYFKAKEDHKHELEVLKVQAEIAKSEHVYKLEEINAQADISETAALYKHAEVKPSGIPWIDALINFYAGTVRPTITYVFMAAYCLVKFAQYKAAIAYGDKSWDTIVKLWNSEDMAVFATILSFWFGSRMMKYSFGRMDKVAAEPTDGKTNGHSQPGLVPVITPSVPPIIKHEPIKPYAELTPIEPSREGLDGK